MIDDNQAENPVQRYTVSQEDVGLRLDQFLAAKAETLSRSRLQTLIKNGFVLRNAEPVQDRSIKVRENDIYDITPPPLVEAIPKGEQIALEVLYEDDAIIVIDKPAGLVVHPGAGNSTGTLVNALIAHCGESLSGIGGVARPGIVHRLDKDTSGVMVVAKTDVAHQLLSKQFADHGRTGDLVREYIAIVWNKPQLLSGRIETNIARHPTQRTKMANVKSGGREAITFYEVEKVYDIPKTASAALKSEQKTCRLSLIRCRLETGRTHQVRVHMASLKTPIVSDLVYGSAYSSKINNLPEQIGAAMTLLIRQALHAELLRFRHPTKHKILTFRRQLPEDMGKLSLEMERFAVKMANI